MFKVLIYEQTPHLPPPLQYLHFLQFVHTLQAFSPEHALSSEQHDSDRAIVLHTNPADAVERITAEINNRFISTPLREKARRSGEALACHRST